MRRASSTCAFRLLTFFVLVNAITMLEVHAPNGAQYFVSAQQITSMRQPVPADIAHFANGTRCIIVTTAAKFVAVKETCDEVRAMIGDSNAKR